MRVPLLAFVNIIGQQEWSPLVLAGSGLAAAFDWNLDQLESGGKGFPASGLSPSGSRYSSLPREEVDGRKRESKKVGGNRKKGKKNHRS